MSLKLEHVTKEFNQTVALADINLDIQMGEFIAVLGPSGCGKTTLLHAIGGFIAPASGTIRFGEHIYFDAGEMVPVEERNLGMVFQSFALWPHMTVREHIEFPMKSKRQNHLSAEAKEEAVDRALDSMGLMSYANRLPGELSGGQRQRVSLARAIVGQPSILLMDEPLSALDAELKISMRKEIQDIHLRTGATIIYVTHDQSEALAMADRIIVMKEGRIEQIGTPTDIYEHPRTEFVASFVSKCNMLKGCWEGDTFTPAGQTVSYQNPTINDIFKSKGLYPVRPEQFELAREGQGLMGTIINKQYNGREIHYLVAYEDDIYTIYTDGHTNFERGDEVRLSIK